MNIQQPKIDLKNNFELYLEGIKVDFGSITISETEGGIPAASITFPSSYGAARILPGTIVQIFGYVHSEKKTFLLFEGEVTGLNYQKSESNKIVVIKAISLLGSMIKAKFRPADAIMTKDRKVADGLQEERTVITNEKGADIPVGSTTNDNLKDVSNKETQTVKGKVKDIGLTAVYGLADDFQRMFAEDKPGGKGDFIPMLQQFNSYFENNDLFYGLRSLAFKFGRSVFATPNPDLLRKIKVDLFLEALNKIQSSGIENIYNERPYTLMQVLTEFQKYMHYSLITPASYTACQPFYVKGFQDSNEPLRLIFMPSIEAGPPALCNIFFPEQVSAFTFSRDMMNEPTRIVGRATVPFMQPSSSPIDFSPCITFPEIDLDESVAVGNFTFEETYKGINPKVISYTNLQSDLIIDKKTTNNNGKKTSEGEEVNEDDAKGDIGNLLKPFAYMDYTQMKYAGRSMSLSAEWSPYRMIGFPALMLDSDGISVVGTINSIESTITSQGSAVSRVMLRGTRLVYDSEFEKSVFSNVPSDNQVGYEKYLVHDLTNDGMMATNELLFYKDLYSFENIGKDVYTYILNGLQSPAEGFYKVKDENDVFTYADNNLDPDNAEFIKDTKYDSSILNYLRDEDGNLRIDIPNIYNKKTEIRNTYLLYKAVNKLRSIYESKKYATKKGTSSNEYDMTQAYNYINLITKRNIIQKGEYMSFIGANLSRSAFSDDAHDGTVVFTDKGVTELRESIQTSMNNQYVAVITADNSKKYNNKNRITKINSLLEEKNPYKSQSRKRFISDYMADMKQQGNFIHESTAAIHADNNWPSIQALLDEKKTLEDEIRNINKNKVATATEIDFDTEVYKPYNITRRMHVVEAFKNNMDVLVDNNKSKLTVIK